MMFVRASALLPALLSRPYSQFPGTMLYEDPGPEHLRTVDNFFRGAEALRAVFDEVCARAKFIHATVAIWLDP